jgi:hypothetical protein
VPHKHSKPQNNASKAAQANPHPSDAETLNEIFGIKLKPSDQKTESADVGSRHLKDPQYGLALRTPSDSRRS